MARNQPTIPGQRRYYVQAIRNPRHPNGAVHFYAVFDDGLERDGKRSITTVKRFSVREYGADVALHLANTLRDDLNAGIQ